MPPVPRPIPWKVSLHGGHSSAYCDHAHSPLREMVEAAVAAGLDTYGMTEHAPRVEPRYLYPAEVKMGWNVATLEAMFEAYAGESAALKGEYAGCITLLRGFEAEVVPEDRYVDLMLGYRRRFGFDFMVGSVHHVAGHIIDYTPEQFQAAVAACGGLEKLCIRYYETLAEMVPALQPEVVAHFDLVRRYGPDEAAVGTPKIRAAAERALEAVRAQGAILDINTAGYRKGLGRPYPAPWILERAREMRIPCCFGDDSHRVREVGAGLEDARAYLLANGIREICALTPEAQGLARRVIALE